MRTYAILFLTAAILAFALSHVVRALALRLDIVDRPDKRKMHQIPIPLLGGLAVFSAFGLVGAGALFLDPALRQEALQPFLGLMAGAIPIVLLGLYDDVKGLKAPAKLAGQVASALIVLAMGARVEAFTNPLGDSIQLGWIGVPVAVLWIVGVTNAVNLIDGLDGLAVGIGTIAALGLFAVAVSGSAFVAAMAITLAGAGLGFLRHNFYPAKIFLGDTGSMFMGFSLAVLGLQGSLKATTATVLFIPIIVLGVPLFDTVFAIFRRARRGVSPFKADREHVHHRLVRVGLHHRNVVLVLYFVCAYLALTAYSISMFPYQTAFLFLVLLTMGGIIGLRTLRFIEERLEANLAASPAVQPGRGDDSEAPRARGSNVARQGSPYSTLVCEVRGLREDFGGRMDLRVMCVDISSVLSHRLKVYGVRAEPIAPGRLLMLIRCERLEPSLEEQVKEGIHWYLEDQKGRFSSEPGFPMIQWLEPAADAPPERRTVGRVASGSEASRHLPLGSGRTRVLG